MDAKENQLLSVRDIANAVGMPNKSVYNAINKLHEHGIYVANVDARAFQDRYHYYGNLTLETKCIKPEKLNEIKATIFSTRCLNGVAQQVIDYLQIKGVYQNQGEALFQNRFLVFERMEYIEETFIKPLNKRVRERDKVLRDRRKKEAEESARLEEIKRKAREEEIKRREEERKKLQAEIDPLAEKAKALRQVLGDALQEFQSEAYPRLREIAGAQDHYEDSDLVIKCMHEIPQPLYVQLRKIAWNRRMKFWPMVTEALQLYETLFADCEIILDDSFEISEKERKKMKFGNVAASLKRKTKDE